LKVFHLESNLMDFKVKENIFKFGFSNQLTGLFLNLLKLVVIIILIPVLLIGWIIGQFKKEKHVEIENSWTIFKDFGSFKVLRLFIEEEATPDNLDYPEDGGDIYLFKIKLDPIISDIEELYFDMNEAETNAGLYLISYNTKGKGMVLWCISKATGEVKKVKDLLNIDWSLTNEDEVSVRLRGEDKKHGYDYLIKEA